MKIYETGCSGSRRIQAPRRAHVLLGACGSVAAWNFDELCHMFCQKAEVRAIATKASLHYIDRTSLSNDVILYTDEDEVAGWDDTGDNVLHKELQSWADVMVIAPLSANTLGKVLSRKLYLPAKFLLESTENYGCEVVCFTADVGQGIKELDGLEQKAKASGACQLIVKDLKEEFVKDYVFPCVRAGLIYERKYLLGTSMARPVIAKAMVDVAKAVGADAVAHGCTGKGNDQVRFELTFFALDPKLNVVAPWREWDITGREDAIEYAKKHNVPVPVTKKSIYSRDGNLWHLSHEGDILEDPENEPKKDMYMLTDDPEDAPNEPEYVEIGIVKGYPVSVNGQELSPASLLTKLNEIGKKHGIGRIDMVENRLVGMKSRGVYETPGGTILFAAVRELESLTLDRESMQYKDTIALKYTELVYAGRWFDPLRKSFEAFMETISETTTGSVTLKLYKGSVNVTSRKSPYSLYREDISSFENGDIYDQADAGGYIRLYGLPMRVRAMLEDQNKEDQNNEDQNKEDHQNNEDQNK